MERGSGLPAQAELIARAARAARSSRDEDIVKQGRRRGRAALPGRASAEGDLLLADADATARSARPARSPTCSADSATVWTASQGTHGNRDQLRALPRLPRDQVRVDLSRRRRLLRHERPRRRRRRRRAALAGGRPAGARAMDARGRARLGPQGPAATARSRGAVDTDGKIVDWRTEMWMPKATRGLPNIPLLGPEAAGLAQPHGLSTGQISRTPIRPTPRRHPACVVHWLKDTPLRPAPIRAPGKLGQLLRGRELHRRARRRGRAGSAGVPPAAV